MVTPRELGILLALHRDLRRAQPASTECLGCRGEAEQVRDAAEADLCDAHLLGRVIVRLEHGDNRPVVQAIVTESRAYPDWLSLCGTDGVRRTLKEQLARTFKPGDAVEVRLVSPAKTAFPREVMR